MVAVLLVGLFVLVAAAAVGLGVTGVRRSSRSADASPTDPRPSGRSPALTWAVAALTWALFAVGAVVLAIRVLPALALLLGAA